MKDTLTTSQIADRLKADENAGWSYAGARALAEYLEQYEEDAGEELELDVVAIRCDYSEYETLREWAEGYFGEKEAKEKFDIEKEEDWEDKEKEIKEYITDNGQLVEFDGGIIVSAF